MPSFCPIGRGEELVPEALFRILATVENMIIFRFSSHLMILVTEMKRVVVVQIHIHSHPPKIVYYLMLMDYAQMLKVLN
jgi:hypothetical protein